MTAIISYGGGVQSTALVVLAVGGRVNAEAALFANVGDDSERKRTLDYVRDIATPWAAARGFPIHELRRQRRDGSFDTLRQHLARSKRSIDIPVRMADTGAPGNRKCSPMFKRSVVARWLRDNADLPADVMIGFSIDEIERVGRQRDDGVQHSVYPLLDLGLNRSGCEQVIRDAGLPVPSKSACYFCPYHRPQTWAEMRRDEPDEFAAAQVLEDEMNVRRDTLGRDHVYLTKFGKRLSDAIGEAQPALFDGDGSDIGEVGCDDGSCFT